ncbi:MAG: tetratricopeptide repeat protein [Anaerolineae bacterium]|nr:tetratricopeptide repeat protein [Anaerolineae bacterium]
MVRNRLLLGGIIVALLLGAVALGIYYSSRPTPLPEVDLDTAKAQMDSGEYTAARDALLQLAETDTQDAEVQFLLGVTYFNLNEFDQARAAFSRSMELDPERAAAVHHNLGALAYQQGDMEGALSEFQQALEIDPGDADTHYQLGATYLVMAFPAGALTPDAEMLSKSVSEFETSLELSPGEVEALVGLGNVYLLQNQVDKAIESLEAALEVDPEMREALFALGRAYATAGEVDLAKETLQRFLDTDPPEMWKQQAEDLLSQLGS